MSVAARFHETFGDAPAAVASAPGRLEILGNHTRAATHAPRGWAAYVSGVARALGAGGHELPPFRAVIDSSLPLGAGMASSAALEVALVMALAAWRRLRLSPTEVARIAQACEHGAIGAPTGLMDPLTSLFAHDGHLLESEYRELSTRQVPMPGGLVWVVVDSGVQHDLTHEYASRRASCERAVTALAARFPSVRALRDVSPAMLAAAAGALDPEDAARARHVVDESERVRQGAALLDRAFRERSPGPRFPGASGNRRRRFCRMISSPAAKSSSINR